MARVLVVDDEETVLQSLEILLTSEGHDIVRARQSEHAVQLLHTERFDLMITDIRMTPVDGMELIKLARDLQPDMPCIVISAFGSEKAIAQSFNMGVIAFIKKPFKIHEVLSAVAKALSTKT